MKIIIPDDFVLEALSYSEISREFTSNRHDFHEGGLSAKQRKMFEGKLGEKGFKKLLIDNNIKFVEDFSSHTEADLYDFIVYDENNKSLTVDVKTRTQAFHTRTLEMVEQFKKRPKDIYISIRLFLEKPYSVQPIGFALGSDFLKINRIQNQGYLDNYVLFDQELTEINKLFNSLKKNEE